MRLHDADYIHKDLKPSNVMLSHDVGDDKAQLRIIDLGGACRVNRGASDRCKG